LGVAGSTRSAVTNTCGIPSGSGVAVSAGAAGVVIARVGVVARAIVVVAVGETSGVAVTTMTMGVGFPDAGVTVGSNVGNCKSGALGVKATSTVGAPAKGVGGGGVVVHAIIMLARIVAHAGYKPARNTARKCLRVFIRFFLRRFLFRRSILAADFDQLHLRLIPLAVYFDFALPMIAARAGLEIFRRGDQHGNRCSVFAFDFDNEVHFISLLSPE
jgi:hypothetical protein